MSVITYLVFLLFSLGQFGRISLLDGQINFYLYEIFLLPILAVFVASLRLKPIKRTLVSFKIAYLLVGALFLSYLMGIFAYNPAQNLVAFLYLLRLLFYPLFAFYLYFFVKKYPQLKEILKRGVHLLFFLLASSSIIQYFLYPDLRNLYYLGWDPHLNRLFGVFFDTSLAASIFGLIFFYLYKQGKIIPSLIFLILLILTFSRSAYLFLGLILVVDILLKRNIRLGLTVILFCLAVFMIVPKQFGQGVSLNRVFSVTSRLDDYRKGMKIFLSAPLLGHGYNRLEFVKDKMNLSSDSKDGYRSHAAASLSSSFLIILASSGIVGMGLFLSFLLKLIQVNRQIATGIAFVTLMSLADNILLHPFMMFSLAVVLISFPYQRLRR